MGGILALLVTGETWNVSSLVGLIGLFGIAVQNGLVLVTQTRNLRAEGKPFEDAVKEASIGRVRPKIMTASTAILGLLPLLILNLHGTEIERSLAIVTYRQPRRQNRNSTMAQRGWLRIEKRKAGETWVLRYEVIRPIDGKRVEQTKAIGLWRDFPSHDLARAEADRQCPNLEQPNFKGQVTFRHIGEHFLKEECADKTRAASTLEDRNRILTKILIPRWGSRAALSIKAPEVKQWKRAYQAEQDIQDATMKKILDIMGAVYRLAIVDGLVPLTENTNPVRPVERSAETDYTAVIVEPKQALAILLGMQQPKRTLTLVVAATGLRISEALGLQWQDADWLNNRIQVIRKWTSGVGPEKPKSKASKAPVPLHQILAAFLRAWQQETLYSKPTDWVFASDRLEGKQPRTANMLVEDHLRPAAIKAGVKLEPGQRFGFHNLRHSLATFLVNSGTDAKTVQTLLRHADVSTTLQLYTQGSLENGLTAQGNMLAAIDLPLPGLVN